MVGAWDVYSQVDDVIYVDAVRPSWVDGNDDNQLQTLHEGD